MRVGIAKKRNDPHPSLNSPIFPILHYCQVEVKHLCRGLQEQLRALARTEHARMVLIGSILVALAR